MKRKTVKPKARPVRVTAAQRQAYEAKRERERLFAEMQQMEQGVRVVAKDLEWRSRELLTLAYWLREKADALFPTGAA